MPLSPQHLCAASHQLLGMICWHSASIPGSAFQSTEKLPKINSFSWQTSIVLLLNNHCTKAGMGGERQLHFPLWSLSQSPWVPCSQERQPLTCWAHTGSRQKNHKTANTYSHPPLLTVLPTRSAKGSLQPSTPPNTTREMLGAVLWLQQWGPACSTHRSCQCHCPSLHTLHGFFSLHNTICGRLEHLLFYFSFLVLGQLCCARLQPCPWLLSSRREQGARGTPNIQHQAWLREFQGYPGTLHPFCVSLCWGIVSAWLLVPCSTHAGFQLPFSTSVHWRHLWQ